jgi:hypothetical protein
MLVAHERLRPFSKNPFMSDIGWRPELLSDSCNQSVAPIIIPSAGKAIYRFPRLEVAADQGPAIVL